MRSSSTRTVQESPNPEIPSAFILSIQGALPNNAILRDKYSNSWHVNVAKVGDTFYLKDGWAKFVGDNFINRGDMLVFECYGKGLFSTKIYDSSGCEKKGVGAFRATNEETKAVMEEDKEDEGDDEEQEGTTKDSDEKEEEEGKDEDETNDNDDNYIVVSETDDEGEEEIRTSNVHAPIGKHGTSSNTSEKQSRCRRVPDIYGEEIFRTGLATYPKHPYFITKINPGRKGELYIPMDLIKVQNLNLPKEILLLDPSGRKWSARLKQWRDGRTYYRGGWRRLCKTNLIGDDDLCICEFIKRGERLCLNISFVRANRD
ncbi:UNVERIFIED_CONTAM: hypothetical protein Sindi_2422200 [Sesamum indicum]